MSEIDPAVKCALMDQARWRMGIYPSSVTDSDGTRERTEWQDGWNAAMIASSEYEERLFAWFSSLPAGISPVVGGMLAADVIEAHADEGQGISLWVSVSEQFTHAADAERVDMNDVPSIASAWRMHGDVGVLAWVAVRRGDAPFAKLRTTAYHEALDAIVTRKVNHETDTTETASGR